MIPTGNTAQDLVPASNLRITFDHSHEPYSWMVGEGKVANCGQNSQCLEKYPKMSTTVGLRGGVQVLGQHLLPSAAVVGGRGYCDIAIEEARLQYPRFSNRYLCAKNNLLDRTSAEIGVDYGTDCVQ